VSRDLFCTSSKRQKHTEELSRFLNFENSPQFYREVNVNILNRGNLQYSGVDFYLGNFSFSPLVGMQSTV